VERPPLLNPTTVADLNGLGGDDDLAFLFESEPCEPAQSNGSATGGGDGGPVGSCSHKVHSH
jgi:hypothetical protein